jgi:hypothetical protein
MDWDLWNLVRDAVAETLGCGLLIGTCVGFAVIRIDRNWWRK